MSRHERRPRKVSAIVCGLIALAASVPVSLAEGRDPTAPPRVVAAAGAPVRKAPPPVTVSALFLAPEGSHAVVNGEVVHAGDLRHGIEITSIGADGVCYRRGGRLACARPARPDLAVKSAVEEKNP